VSKERGTMQKSKVSNAKDEHDVKSGELPFGRSFARSFVRSLVRSFIVVEKKENDNGEVKNG
jgi:hypothetical protein